MFKSIRAWLAARKQRRLEKYAEEYGFMDPGKLEQLRRQQSPMRRGRGSNR